MPAAAASPYVLPLVAPSGVTFSVHPLVPEFPSRHVPFCSRLLHRQHRAHRRAAPAHSADITRACSDALTASDQTDVLQDIAGIYSRRMWDDGTLASDAATMAAEKALADLDISRDQIGLLVNTSVSRDFLEPSTASIVCGNLGLSENCQNFDVANACLAFLNGMDIASRMLERGEIVRTVVAVVLGVTACER